MLGKNHLLVGTAGFLVAGQATSTMLGDPLSGPELICGAVVCAGAAMLPDIDHPQATVARSLGPVTGFLSRVVSKLAGGHRNGTHSLLALFLVYLGMGALLAWGPEPWTALAVCFFFTSLALRTLTEADGFVCAALSAFIAAGLVLISPDPAWLAFAVAFGHLLHLVGDVLTPEGVPPLWPVSKVRISIPIVGHTGDWRENVIAGACGLLACFILASSVFIPMLEDRSDVGASAPQEHSAVAAKKAKQSSCRLVDKTSKYSTLRCRRAR